MRARDKKLLFISYANKDKDDVGILCDILVNKYGYDVFRAHDTIEIGEEWKDEIIKNLEECDGLIAWVTTKFRARAWTHQECGYAIAKNITLYPILMMKTIPGILEFVQGLPVKKPLDFEYIADKIHKNFTYKATQIEEESRRILKLFVTELKNNKINLQGLFLSGGRDYLDKRSSLETWNIYKTKLETFYHDIGDFLNIYGNLEKLNQVIISSVGTVDYSDPRFKPHWQLAMITEGKIDTLLEKIKSEYDIQ